MKGNSTTIHSSSDTLVSVPRVPQPRYLFLVQVFFWMVPVVGLALLWIRFHVHFGGNVL